MDGLALQRLQQEYAPDISAQLDKMVVEIDPAIFERLARVTPATGVMSIAERPTVNVDAMLNGADNSPVVFLEKPRNLFNIGAAG